MESVSNISSEEELLELLNEGKISEDEYEQLRQTLAKPSKTESEPPAQDSPMPTRTSGLAIVSFILSLLSLVLGPLGFIPGIVCGHLARREIKKYPTIRGSGLALAGLIIGYVFFVFFTVMAIINVYVIFFRPRQSTTILRWFPITNMRGVIAQSNVQFDKQISSDGNGSLRIEATEPTTIRLFETGNIDIQNVQLIYRAMLRTENVEGQVYLEMWCHFPGRGEFFARDLMTPLTGTKEWTMEETPFFLKEGENPDNVKLNLVINGKGTVWIDNIRLVDVRLVKGLLELLE